MKHVSRYLSFLYNMFLFVFKLNKKNQNHESMSSYNKEAYRNLHKIKLLNEKRSKQTEKIRRIGNGY